MDLDDLSIWKAFIHVGQQGGFSKASRSMGIAVPILSKRIAKLESHLGVRLFQRSTRVVTLTDEGKALLPKAMSLLEDYAALHSTLKGSPYSSVDIAGTVRVTCVPFVAHRLLAPRLHAFWKQYPKIKIAFDLTETFANLIEQQIDMAIRIDEPSDSDLVYRRLAPNPLIFCAAPSYLKKSGSDLKTPRDLDKHPLLFLKVLEECRFKGSLKRIKDIKGITFAECDNGMFLTDLALAGQGILIRSVWDVQEHLRKGSLVQVLKNHPLEVFGHIHAVIPTNRYLAPRVRAFFDFVVDEAKSWDASSVL